MNVRISAPVVVINQLRDATRDREHHRAAVRQVASVIDPGDAHVAADGERDVRRDDPALAAGSARIADAPARVRAGADHPLFPRRRRCPRSCSSRPRHRCPLLLRPRVPALPVRPLRPADALLPAAADLPPPALLAAPPGSSLLDEPQPANAHRHSEAHERQEPPGTIVTPSSCRSHASRAYTPLVERSVWAKVAPRRAISTRAILSGCVEQHSTVASCGLGSTLTAVLLAGTACGKAGDSDGAASGGAGAMGSGGSGAGQGPTAGSGMLASGDGGGSGTGATSGGSGGLRSACGARRMAAPARRLVVAAALPVGTRGAPGRRRF